MKSVTVKVKKNLKGKIVLRFNRLSKRQLEIVRDAQMNKQKGPTCWFEVFTATIRAHVDPATLPGFANFVAIKDDLGARRTDDGADKVIAAANANAGLTAELKAEIEEEPTKRYHIALACFGSAHVSVVRPKKFTLASIGKQIQDIGPFYASYYPYPKPNYMDDVFLVVEAAKGLGGNLTPQQIGAALSREANKINMTLTPEALATAITKAKTQGFLTENKDKTLTFAKVKEKDPPHGTAITITVPKGKDKQTFNAIKPNLVLPDWAKTYQERIKNPALFDQQLLKLNGRSWGTGAHAMLVIGSSDTNGCLLVRNPQNPTPILAPKLEHFIFTGQEEGLVVGFSYKP